MCIDSLYASSPLMVCLVSIEPIRTFHGHHGHRGPHMKVQWSKVMGIWAHKNGAEYGTIRDLVGWTSSWDIPCATGKRGGAMVRRDTHTSQLHVHICLKKHYNDGSPGRFTVTFIEIVEC